MLTEVAAFAGACSPVLVALVHARVGRLERNALEARSQPNALVTAQQAREYARSALDRSDPTKAIDAAFASRSGAWLARLKTLVVEDLKQHAPSPEAMQAKDFEWRVFVRQEIQRVVREELEHLRSEAARVARESANEALTEHRIARLEDAERRR